MSEWDDVQIEVLVGKTLVSAEQVGRDRVQFVCTDGTAYALYHSSDCCESVEIESIVGELDNLVGSPILMADESASENVWPANIAPPEYMPESYTWTFYKFATLKGYVDIRWLGESNGYYSETVSFAEVK